MGGQRTVLEAARSKQPAATVGFEGEGIRAGMQVDADALLLRRRIGCLFQREIRNVDPGPAPRAGVPPDVLLSLRPGVAGGVRRGAVIEDAPVAGPGETPLWVDVVSGSAVSASRHVLTRRGKHAGINPDAASRGAVILQGLVTRELFVIGDRVAVDFHQDLLRRGVVTDSILRIGMFWEVVPGKVAQSLVPRIRRLT